jgi:response regulator of citrate/malate metabolism
MEVIKVSETHLTYAELGSEIGISESTARRILKEANVDGNHDRDLEPTDTMRERE